MNKTNNDATDEVFKTAANKNNKRRPIYQLLLRHFIASYKFIISGCLTFFVGIDIEFEHVLDKIFGKELMEHYRQKCPMGWVDLMVAFESKKRSANPDKSSSLNVSLPFSFIDYYKRHKVSLINQG